MIRIQCPHCGNSATAKADWAGKRVKCRKCGGVLNVPRPAPDLEPDDIGANIPKVNIAASKSRGTGASSPENLPDTSPALGVATAPGRRGDDLAAFLSRTERQRAIVRTYAILSIATGLIVGFLACVMIDAKRTYQATTKFDRAGSEVSTKGSGAIHIYGITVYETDSLTALNVTSNVIGGLVFIFFGCCGFSLIGALLTFDPRLQSADAVMESSIFRSPTRRLFVASIAAVPLLLLAGFTSARLSNEGNKATGRITASASQPLAENGPPGLTATMSPDTAKKASPVKEKSERPIHELARPVVRTDTPEILTLLNVVQHVNPLNPQAGDVSILDIAIIWSGLQQIEKTGQEEGATLALVSVIAQKQRSSSAADERVYQNALIALSKIGPKASASLPIVNEAARHPNKSIQRAANVALENIKSIELRDKG